jgi:spore maturation protein CgeB
VKVLLLSPVFHGYWQSIADGFIRDGHEAQTFTYDALPLLRDKAANKLLVEMPGLVGLDRTPSRQKRVSAAVARRLATSKVDLVVVVKGDLIDSEVYAGLHRRHVPVVLWLYDELRRTRHSIEDLRTFTAVATYSPRDRQRLCELGIPAFDLPVAFDERFSASGTPSGAGVVFVGARYPRRTTILAELHGRGVPVIAYGRDWSRRPADRVRTLSWSRPPVPGAPDVSRMAAAQLMHDAWAAINIHGDQDGFNPRTFEACGTGAVQLIDRADVAELYEPGHELLTFAEVDELIELVRRVRTDTALTDRIRAAARTRTLSEHTFVHRCRVLMERC